MMSEVDEWSTPVAFVSNETKLWVFINTRALTSCNKQLLHTKHLNNCKDGRIHGIIVKKKLVYLKTPSPNLSTEPPCDKKPNESWWNKVQSLFNSSIQNLYRLVPKVDKLVKESAEEELVFRKIGFEQDSVASELLCYLETISVPEYSHLTVTLDDLVAALESNCAPVLTKKGIRIGDIVSKLKQIISSHYCYEAFLIEQLYKEVSGDKVSLFVDLVSKLHKLTTDAGFRILSKAEMETCNQLEGYVDDIPIAMNASQLDSTLFKSLMNIDPYRDAALLPYCLIYSKGIGLETSRGFLLWGKLRALEVTYLGWIERPFDTLVKLAFYVASWIRKRRDHEYLLHKTSTFWSGKSKTTTKQEKMPFASLEKAFVRRITPPRKLSIRWKQLRTLIRPSLIQEPTFEHVFVLFIPSQHDVDSENINSPERMTKPSPKLWLFKDVPRAGLGLILPEKKLQLTTIDIFRLDIATIFGIFSVIYTNVSHSNQFNLAFLSIATSIYYVFRVWFTYQATKDQYRTVVAERILRSHISSDTGVLYSLAAQAVDQQLRISLLYLLGYYSQNACDLNTCSDGNLIIDYARKVMQQKHHQYIPNLDTLKIQSAQSFIAQLEACWSSSYE